MLFFSFFQKTPKQNKITIKIDKQKQVREKSKNQNKQKTQNEKNMVLENLPLITSIEGNSRVSNPNLVWKRMYKINNLLIFICIRRFPDSFFFKLGFFFLFYIAVCHCWQFLSVY